MRNVAADLAGSLCDSLRTRCRNCAAALLQLGDEKFPGVAAFPGRFSVVGDNNGIASTPLRV